MTKDKITIEVSREARLFLQALNQSKGSLYVNEWVDKLVLEGKNKLEK